MITLLDYGAGNVRSVINAIESLGESVQVATRAEDIQMADKIVFPGVGAFGNMMRMLHAKGLVAPLKAHLSSGRPFLGICLGLQALFESSEESPGIPGLGHFKGVVKRFDTDLAVPHMGWNGIRIRQPSGIFSGMAGNEQFYFVHSYHVVPEDTSVVLTTTDYGFPFVSAVQQGNLIATQYHPEKSGACGLRLLRNFLQNAAPPCDMDHNSNAPTRLAKRIIACLDVRANDQNDLVVTKGDRYDVREMGAVRNLGKPVALARQYYEDGADEIAFLNITGYRDFPLEDAPMLEVLRQTSRQVFVPLTIGGGIRDYTDVRGQRYSALEVAYEYFRSGADKISIGSDAVAIAEAVLRKRHTPGSSAIERISQVYGSQAVVISIDPRRVYVRSPQMTDHEVIETVSPGPQGEKFCWYQCTVNGGREGRPVDAVTLARVCQDLGAGEVLLNCIDRDGTGAGFDIELIRAVKQAVSIPVIASSGAGTAEHFHAVFAQTGVESALAAGIFHRRELSIQAVKNALADRVEIRRVTF